MGNSLTVFLIEDDEQVLFMLNDFIKSRFPHFTVRTFVNGENALEAINEMPHVIVLDYFLNSKDILTVHKFNDKNDIYFPNTFIKQNRWMSI